MSYWELLLVIGAVALGFVYIIAQFIKVKKQPVTNEKVAELQKHIRGGAMTFLKSEYKIIAIFIVALSVLIAAFLGREGEFSLFSATSIATAVSFVVGGVFAMVAGFIAMRAATLANGPTAQAAKDGGKLNGMARALNVSFAGGSIAGITLTAVALLGLATLIIIFSNINVYNTTDPTEGISTVISIVYGFALGASVVALFARVGGGIYTKAADVGADLVGKVEAGIPEDDPRNPAVIADNVGDNVGDVAGLGADLYESYISSIVAACSLGALLANPGVDIAGRVLFPLLVSAGGLLACIAACFWLTKAKTKDPGASLRNATIMASILSAVATFGLSFWLLDESYRIAGFLAVLFGIAVGVGIGLITEFYTSDKYRHVKYVKKMSETGSATNIIGGFATGMFSTWPVILIMGIGIAAATIMGVPSGQEMYFLALCSVGMLSTVGITVSVDAYGPIADNAGGLVEMAHLGDDIREITDHLDAVGNTTAAIGKGVCMGSAAFTVLGLFATFIAYLRTDEIGFSLYYLSINNPIFIIMAMIGAAVPYLFSAFTIKSVGKAANDMIVEVRRQFKETPGLIEGKEGVIPDYNKCVAISTKAALREMIMPGVISVTFPVLTGILFGFPGVAGLILGVFVSGLVIALFMGNAGGIWDNAKKAFSSSGKKGSEEYKAAVIGDTVGDPLKDTAGPAIDILMKQMAILAIILLPVFYAINDGMGLLGRWL